MLILPDNLNGVPGSGRNLIVILHGLSGKPERMRWIRGAVRMATTSDKKEWLPHPEFLIPTLPISPLSFVHPNEIVEDLLTEIDRRWEANKGAYDKIILIGHSVGALIARKIYVVACGEQKDAPFEEQFANRMCRPWAHRVDRIILFAGMNRGWQIDLHMGLKRAFLWQSGVFIFSAYDLLRVIFGLRPHHASIMSVRRGGDFITQLRIQWLRMRHAKKHKKRDELHHAMVHGAEYHPSIGQAITVQLLGSIDDIVSPDDNVDLISGSDFYYFDVPYSGHKDVIRLDDGDAGVMRAMLFRKALIYTKSQLGECSIIPHDDPRIRPNHKKRHIIFVLHGIRDEGHWTSKVARKVLELARCHNRLDEFGIETAAYGFFPILPFLLPWKRRQKVEWFMDRYAEMVARYPNAHFDFIGHSNGTYCLAKSLKLYSCCRVRNVVFAGSVVRQGFDWDKYIPAQAASVLNYVATADWVVGFFPNFFETIPVADLLGGAGHRGFYPHRDVKNATYVRGHHSAALREQNWDHIAHFLSLIHI